MSDVPGKKTSGRENAKKERPAAQDKKKNDRDTKAVTIKSPGAKIKDDKDAPSGRRKQKEEAKDKDKETGKKGILKKKPGNRGKSGASKSAAPKKKQEKVKKQTVFEKMAKYFGFFVGKVTLIDPMAVEAVQALDLQPWHLRRLRARFNIIDIDGSGAIDYDEFFEAVGEDRSPFTDKLFALIGKH